MCGRFTLTAPAKQVESLFDVVLQDELSGRYNIAPTQPILTIHVDADGQRLAESMRWGLIPYWAKDASIGNRCLNARAETIHEKASFREPIRRRRCLIPASGFFEWRREGKKRFPTYFHFVDNLGAFAGVWEKWKNGDTWVRSCSIITTTPNEIVSPLHDRMPVVLDPTKFGAWLDPNTPFSEVQPWLIACESERFEAWEVDPRVNLATNEGADLIEPLDTGV